MPAYRYTPKLFFLFCSYFFWIFHWFHWFFSPVPTLAEKPWELGCPLGCLIVVNPPPQTTTPSCSFQTAYVSSRISHRGTFISTAFRRVLAASGKDDWDCARPSNSAGEKWPLSSSYWGRLRLKTRIISVTSCGRPSIKHGNIDSKSWNSICAYRCQSQVSCIFRYLKLAKGLGQRYLFAFCEIGLVLFNLVYDSLELKTKNAYDQKVVALSPSQITSPEWLSERRGRLKFTATVYTSLRK